MITYEASEKDKKQIENNFKYHTPKNGQSEKYEEIRRDVERVKNMLRNILSEIEQIKHIEADMFRKFKELQKTKGLKLAKVL